MWSENKTEKLSLVFYAHIDVEEKVITYSKFHLPKGRTSKQSESKILVLKELKAKTLCP